MQYKQHIILTFLLILSALAGTSQKSFYSDRMQDWGPIEEHSERVYTVFLLGDLKYPTSDNRNLAMLKEQLLAEGANSSLVILGDIVYPLGMPDSSDQGFAEARGKHSFLVNMLKDYKGKVVFIPGNHDWAKGKAEGYQHILNQEAFIETMMDRGNTYIPDGGCPGPVEVPLSDDVVLIAFDSQWYFHKFEKPGLDGECGFEDANDMFVMIEDAIRRNRDKKVIFATHHPLFSVGIHGGYFPGYAHLFPMVELVSWMYIPLPGFIYTAYRKYLGSIQDLAHPEYKIFKATLLEIFKDYPNVIYAAGHEHNLQYFLADSLHHIVSGGGGEGTHIARRSSKADFAFAGTGFARLSFYAGGNAWMEFASNETERPDKIVFCRKLFNKKAMSEAGENEIKEQPVFRDSTLRVRLTDIYDKGKFVRFWMGDNYRDIWDMEIELPVFDLSSEHGGLTILKRGGGQQTRSVRLEDGNGRQYVLRSVNKFVEKALADNMRNTIAVDVVQDGISASHPFAALCVPELADAAGVMHTNPRIVWVPDDPALGIYREEMANGIFLYEERPAGNRDDINSFGNSEDIVNTATTVRKTQDEHDHVVDQESVLKARLLDILINDWDRHDDQWRWAKFKEDGKKVYRPIPRDRDQVFFVNQGVMMWIATRNWAMRKFQGFDHNISDIRGLGYNARYFDRSFITEPDKNDWMKFTADLQRSITDSVIHQAIQKLPEDVYQSGGQEIEHILRSRRDDLDKYISEYYLFLSRAVDVVGTDERELFEVNRQENGLTEVNVYALSKKKGKLKEQLYHRVFIPDETREIRLYGLKGKDKFLLHGEAPKGIKVRIVPGKGNDSIMDRSRVRGMGKKTIVYERKDKKNHISGNAETKVILSSDKSIDDYDRKQFKYNINMPLAYLGYNIDDGVFVGGGIRLKRFNFRDSAFHTITGQLALLTRAFAINYHGFVSAFSRTFDFEMDASLSLPRNVDNFFGISNQSAITTDDKKYNRVRYEYAYANPRLKHTLTEHVSYTFGAFYQYFKTTDTNNRFIAGLYPAQLDSSAFAGHHYAGLNAVFCIDTRDDKALPHRGIHWETDLGGFYSIRDEGRNFLRFRSDLSMYLSFRKDPRLVFAFRFGGAGNIGDYEFFHANFLGGKTNLRGFRSNRFAGDYSFYQNTEIRLKVMNLQTYIFNGQTGILLFNDIGRVWVAGEDSQSWHNGYGAGIWVAPFEFTAITLTYNRSGEESIFDFTMRFSF